MFIKNKNYNKGFTLIELLVVVAIIGVLASVTLASLNSVRAKARDAKRLSDMKTIGTALELFYDAKGHYPGPTFEGVSINGEMIGDDNGPIETALKPYLSNIPKDPKHDGTVYFYSYDPQHCGDSVPKSCDCAISSTSAAAYAFNKAEGSTTGLRKDTCSGSDMNISNADFNVTLLPGGP